MTEEHFEHKENTSQHNNRNNHQSDEKKKNSDAKSDEEIIEENLKEILEQKSREERKANGRLVAVIVAFLVIFLAVYHAWIRNTAALAGVIVPAIIMLSYGGWVALLAKREKQRRALFEKHLEEVALKNKLELEEKLKSKHKKPANKNNTTDANATTLHYENEIDSKDLTKNQSKDKAENKSVIEQKKHHRKHHRQRRTEASGNCSSSSSSSRQSSSHHATKDLRSKRPSIRQKLFRQNAATTSIVATQTKNNTSPTSTIQVKKKKLQRLDAMSEPQLIRMGSAP